MAVSLPEAPVRSRIFMLLTREQAPTDHVSVSEDIERRHVRSSEPASHAFREAFAIGLKFFEENDPLARLGDPVGVHRLRTTTRRFRTIVELFEDLTEPDWNRDLASELKWLSAWLGGVRDMDVLKARFLRDAEAIGAAAPLAPLFERLDIRHQEASTALSDVFESERYRGLKGRLADAVELAPLTEDAEEPCRKLLPRLVLISWKRLRKAGRGLHLDHPDEPFHDVRKRAKRARYAAEAVKDLLDPESKSEAKTFARKAKDVQDVLGEHQDAAVAAEMLRGITEEFPHDGKFCFAAGRLLERELTAAATSKPRFFEVFAEIDRRKVVRWLHP